MNNFAARISNVFVDALAGRTVSHRIFGDKPNLEVIKHYASTEVAQEKCREFFLSGAVSDVVRRVVKLNIVKAGDCVVSRQDLHRAVSDVCGNADSAIVITEILCPIFHEMGLLGGTADFTTLITYPNGTVTTEQLRIDAGMQEVVRVLGDVKKVNIVERRYTPGILGDELAAALRPVGLRFSDINEYAMVFSDILTGVRSTVDVTGSVTRITDPAWRDSPILAELAGNATFLMEALDLPFGTICDPKTDGWKLATQALAVHGRLKTSERYKLVSREQAIRRINVRGIFDIENRRCGTVAWESASAMPEAQTVLAYNDAMVKDAVIISATRERGADAVEAAYGNTKAYGTDAAGTTLVRILSHLAEADSVQRYLKVFFADSRERTELEVETLMCMIAGEMRYYYYGAEGDTAPDGKDPQKFVRHFTVTVQRPPFRRGETIEGRMEGDRFITPSVEEMMMAIPDMNASEAVPAREQTLGRASLDARLVRYNIESLIPMKTRFSFALPFADKAVSGAFKLKDIASLRASDGSSFVPATFNRDVMFSTSQILAETLDLIGAIEGVEADDEGGSLKLSVRAGSALAFSLRSIAARKLVDMIRGVSAGWRDEVQKGMIARHLEGAKLSYDDSIEMRAQLRSRSFAALADLFAFVFLMRSQGVIDDTMPVWGRIMKDEALLRIISQEGSDRFSEVI